MVLKVGKGRGIGHKNRLTQGVAAIALTAPALTRTSSAGAVPVTWDATNAVADYFARLQVDGNSDFSSPEQDYTVLITGANMGDTDLLFPDFVQPSGTYYLRMRYERDDGVVSAWSNTLTDTIIAATTVLTSSDGVNKNQYATVSGSPALSWANSVDVGQHVFVRATADATVTQYGFSITLAGLGTNFAVGTDDGTTNAVGAASYPNLSTISNNGVVLWRSGSGSGIRVDGADTALAVAPDTIGDEIIVEVNKGTGSNGTIDFYRLRGGTKTLMGGKTGLSSARLARAVIGSQLASGTVNFGQSALDLNTGYSMYG